MSSSHPPSPTGSPKPRTLHVSKSFTRLESPQSSPLQRSRASTLQTGMISTIPEARDIDLPPEKDGRPNKGDIFDSEEHEVGSDQAGDETKVKTPETFDQLPIEIRSLTERFLESLSSKHHPTPLSIDDVSSLFQDFYVRAERHIDTHIKTLASRLSREKPSAPSASSKKTVPLKGRARSESDADKDNPDGAVGGGEQQMLTASEVADKRRARKTLEMKRVALEEAVERGVCEKVYDRIYQHRSTDDEERDSKLRSRAAALAVVGIGLKDLHVEPKTVEGAEEESTEDMERRIQESLFTARESLRAMHTSRYPLGKLQHLTTAHKSIVETLSLLFPSSSADEILPTLIYTLITSPPEGLNVISDLNFVQRFRCASRVDGEAAYCLVNLEAAISFLETVDLSSLRADEAPEGPVKSSSRPSTPILGKASGTTSARLPAPQRSLTPGLSPVSAISTDLSPGNADSKSLLSPSTPGTLIRPGLPQQRRLSSLIQAQADRLEAGRVDFLNTADQAFDTINNTLESSFKFLFGKLKDQQSSPTSPVIVPKTLEDARKLVGTRSPTEDDTNSVSGRSSIAETAADAAPNDALSAPVDKAAEQPANGKILELVGGKRPTRERSVDSTRSGGSGKRVTFSSPNAENGDVADKAPPPPPPAVPAPASTLMNSLNPLSRFGVPTFGVRFGRSVSGNTPAVAAPTTTTTTTTTAERAKQPGHAAAATEASPTTEKEEEQQRRETRAREALTALRKTKPPLRRFMEVKDAGELRVAEVELLLREYRRLAEAMRDALQAGI
ncbi:hypothetical protein LTR50_000649 [Elasticomyces elasticus]|nr:hypothetical protein LTR50_000649 [Elasticomyces elasticus]